jgi:hypothetical protein
MLAAERRFDSPSLSTFNAGCSSQILHAHEPPNALKQWAFWGHAARSSVNLTGDEDMLSWAPR